MHFFDISTSKSGPEVGCLCILAWTCASRHNGVQFFISHLASWLRTRRFSERTFRPGASNQWKNVSRISYLFAHLDLLSFETFSFLIIFLLLFSDSSHLCFSSVLIVGSLTSKLPSTICMSTHFNIMLLILHGDSSNIRVRMQLLMRLQHLYEQIKYSRVPRTTDWENLRDTNDKKTITKLTRKPASNTIAH